MLKKIILALPLLAAFPANAAVTQISFLDASSGSHNGAFALDASSNDYALSVLCGATTTTLGATVAECAIVNASGQLTTAGTDNITQWAGSTLAAPTAPGTPQTTGLVPTVNVANTNNNGQATAGNSSPVVLPVAQVTVDPCTLSAKTNLAVSTNATTLTQIIAASGSNKIYICSINLIAPGATALNLASGTGTNCGTSTAAIIGSTTAANGQSYAANGGITLGNGAGTVAVAAASSELCTLQSNAVQVAGNITYVQAP